MVRTLVNTGGKGIHEIPTTLEELVRFAKKPGSLSAATTGPMHFAAAVGTPIVSIFGPTGSDRNGPFRREDIVVERRLPAGHATNETSVRSNTGNAWWISPWTRSMRLAGSECRWTTSRSDGTDRVIQTPRPIGRHCRRRALSRNAKRNHDTDRPSCCSCRRIASRYSRGVIRKDSRLATGGPYGWTRNPLYFGSFLLSLGFES